MADLVTSESRRYLHGIQNTIISDDDAGVVLNIIPSNNQLALIDEMEVDGTLTVYGDAYVTSSKSDDSLKEGALGNPSVDGYVLSSTTAGARSWVANGAQTYAQIIAILGFEPLSSCGYGLCYGLKYGGRG